MEVIFTYRARNDLRSIVTYIAKDNPTAADSLQLIIMKKLFGLAGNPHIGRLGRADNTRELVVHSSYIVAYRLKGNVIQILAVRHSARLWPDYW